MDLVSTLDSSESSCWGGVSHFAAFLQWAHGSWVAVSQPQGSQGGQHYTLFRNGHGQGCGSGFLSGQSIGKLRRACMAKPQLHEGMLLPSYYEGSLNWGTPPPECLVIVRTRSH